MANVTTAGVTLARTFGPPVDNPPTIISTPAPLFTEGTAASYDMTQHVSDDGQSTVTYNLTNTLPNGLTFNSSTGLLSYDGVGVASVSSHTLQATDAVGMAESSAFNIEIEAVSSATQWIGVPDPKDEFGGIDILTQPRHADPVSWPSNDTAGYYFVEPDHPSATNSVQGGDLTDSNGNRYGYPDLPRSTPPLDGGDVLAAGSLVYIKGGSYSFGGGGGDFTANGTDAASNAVWIYGDPDDKPTFTGSSGQLQIEANSAYIYFENLIWDKTGGADPTCIRPETGAGGINHVVVRNCEAYGTDNQATGSGTAFSCGGQVSNRNSDWVFYKLHVHELGNYRAPIPSADDVMGVTTGQANDRIWVLDCDIYNVGGDSVRPGTNKASVADPDATNRSKFIYIAGNRFRGNGENGIDVKQCDHCVISQCDIYDFDGTESPEDPGAAIVVHEESDHTYIIGNHIYDAGIGINCTDSSDVFAAFNIIRDITDARAASSAGGYAYNTRGATGAFVNNTVYGCGAGVRVENNQTMEIKNNIFAARVSGNAGSAGSHDLHYELSSGPSNADADYNLFDSADVSIQVATTNYTSLAAYQAGEVNEDNSIEGSPTFVNAAADDYHLQSGSDGIDAGHATLPDIYADYNTEFGVEILVDYDNESRPATAGDYDLGAFEL